MHTRPHRQGYHAINLPSSTAAATGAATPAHMCTRGGCGCCSISRGADGPPPAAAASPPAAAGAPHPGAPPAAAAPPASASGQRPPAPSWRQVRSHPGLHPRTAPPPSAPGHYPACSLLAPTRSCCCCCCCCSSSQARRPCTDHIVPRLCFKVVQGTRPHNKATMQSKQSNLLHCCSHRRHHPRPTRGSCGCCSTSCGAGGDPPCCSPPIVATAAPPPGTPAADAARPPTSASVDGLRPQAGDQHGKKDQAMGGAPGGTRAR